MKKLILIILVFVCASLEAQTFPPQKIRTLNNISNHEGFLSVGRGFKFPAVSDLTTFEPEPPVNLLYINNLKAVYIKVGNEYRPIFQELMLINSTATQTPNYTELVNLFANYPDGTKIYYTNLGGTSGVVYTKISSTLFGEQNIYLNAPPGSGE